MSTPNFPRLNLRNPFIDSESSSTELAEDDSGTTGSAGGKQGGNSPSGEQGRGKEGEPAMVQRPRAGTWNAVRPSSFSENQTTVSQSPYDDPARSYNLYPDDTAYAAGDHSGSEESSGLGDGAVDPMTADLPWLASNPLPAPDGTSVSSPRWTPRSPTNLTTVNHTSTTTTTATAPASTTTTTTTTLVTTNPMTTTKTSSTENSMHVPVKGESASKGAYPSIPKLQLPHPPGPDQTESTKSPRSSRMPSGQKNSSSYLIMDGPSLRALGAGKTDMRLPEFENVGKLRIPKSASLAAQLIIAASKWFQSELNESTARSMLRSGVKMKEQTSGEQEAESENVIENYLAPFTQHYIENSSIPAILDAIRKNYENGIAERIVKMHRQYADDNKTKNTKVTPFNELQDVEQLMEPLIKPLIDALNGEGKGKESAENKGKYESWMYSAYPAPILNLAIHLCAWTKKWGEANSKNPELVEQAKLNAMKSIVATRSFMVPFSIKLKGLNQTVSGGSWNDYYTPLLNYLNSSVTKTMEELIKKVINASEEEKNLIQSFADIAESRAWLSNEKASEKLNASIEQVKAKKPKKLSTRLLDALSPRGKDEKPVSPRKPLKRGGTLNSRVPQRKQGTPEPSSVSTVSSGKAIAFTENTQRLQRLIKNREKFIADYFDKLKSEVFGGMIDETKFPEWRVIRRKFTQEVAKAEDSTLYKNFRKAPDQSLKVFLQDFMFSKRLHNELPSDGLRTLLQVIDQRLAGVTTPSLNEKEKS